MDCGNTGWKGRREKCHDNVHRISLRSKNRCSYSVMTQSSSTVHGLFIKDEGGSDSSPSSTPNLKSHVAHFPHEGILVIDEDNGP